MRITYDNKSYYKPINFNLTYKYNIIHKMLVKLLKLVFGLWPWVVVFGLFFILARMAWRCF